MNLAADKPINKNIKCSLNNCGCRTNPLIWVSKKHKIIFLEIAKCGTSSIKKSLDIYLIYEDFMNAYNFHKINKTNPRIEFQGGNFKRLIKRLLKINSIRNIKNYKKNSDLSLGTERGIYCFQPYFNSMDILLKQFPDFLYFSTIRHPIKRFVSCFNMFSDDDQPFRKKQRADVGKEVNSEKENLDFFIESSLEEPNHHFWPYSKFINSFKDAQNKLIINCDDINENWNLIKSKLRLNNLSSFPPNEYINNSKSKIKISDLSQIQLEKIERIYEEDLYTFKTLFNSTK